MTCYRFIEKYLVRAVIKLIFNTSEARHSHPDLFHLVQSVAGHAGILTKEPISVHIIPTQKLNGFAAGNFRSSSMIGLTQGMLNLPVDCLAAIIAHECGHIKYRHLLKSSAQLLVFDTHRVCVDCVLNRADDSFISRLQRSTWSLQEAVTVKVLDYATLIVFFLLYRHSSRQAEYAADRFAAELYGSKLMVKALRILDSEYEHSIECR